MFVLFSEFSLFHVLTWIHLVVCHGIELSEAADTTAHLATRRCSFLALERLESDHGFMNRVCSCRAEMESKKAQKKMAKRGGTEQGGTTKRMDMDLGEEDNAHDGEMDEDDEDEREVEGNVPRGGSGEGGARGEDSGLRRRPCG